MAPPKQEPKKKIEVVETTETIVNLNDPVKPDDQLVLSNDVRIKDLFYK
jgi:hypothetical protein